LVAVMVNFALVGMGGGLLCSLVGGYVIYADWRNSTDPMARVPKDLKDKVYLVTGANTGIGRSLTHGLASRDAKVYMLCRDMIKCETTRQDIVLETGNKYVYCRKCDLSSQESIRKFVKAFKESKIDGLINNAGVYNAPYSFSTDGVETHFAVNHLGHFLLTYLLLDKIKATATSRIVYLMNLSYRKAELNLTDPNFTTRVFDKSEAFNQSQLANMLTIRKLVADTLADSPGVLVNAAYPGICKTDIKRHMGVDKSITGNVISKPILSPLTSSAESGAKIPMVLATDPDLKDTGKLFSSKGEIDIAEHALDLETARKLFAVDAYWTDLLSKEELEKMSKNQKIEKLITKSLEI